MSAWIVSGAHIDLLITAGLDMPKRNFVGDSLRWYGAHNGELSPGNADVIGGKLWAENYASVNDRYADEAEEPLPGPEDFEGTDTLTYVFERIPGKLDPVVVLKAVRCYEYQSCEHDGWGASEAKLIVESLTSACVDALPGYNEAPWGFGDRHYFTRQGRG